MSESDQMALRAIVIVVLIKIDNRNVQYLLIFEVHSLVHLLKGITEVAMRGRLWERCHAQAHVSNQNVYCDTEQKVFVFRNGMKRSDVVFKSEL